MLRIFTFLLAIMFSFLCFYRVFVQKTCFALFGKRSRLSLALIGLFVSTVTAQAFEMRSPSALQLRQGPGNHYARSSQIAPKQTIKVGVCNPSWCYARAGAKAGWIATEKINPSLAQMGGNIRQYQASNNSVSDSIGGGRGNFSSSSGRQRLQSSTTMTVSVEIVAKNETKSKKKAKKKKTRSKKKVKKNKTKSKK